MIARIHAVQAPRGNSPALRPPATVPGRAFSAVLDEARSARGVRFSAHAQERLERRGLGLDSEDMTRIGAAVDEAAARGARDALILDERFALIVSVPQRTVITVVASDAAAPAVFTRIDTAVVLPKANTGLDGGQQAIDINHGPDPNRGGPGAAERLTRRHPLEV